MAAARRRGREESAPDFWPQPSVLVARAAAGGDLEAKAAHVPALFHPKDSSSSRLHVVLLLPVERSRNRQQRETVVVVSAAAAAAAGSRGVVGMLGTTSPPLFRWRGGVAVGRASCLTTNATAHSNDGRRRRRRPSNNEIKEYRSREYELPHRKYFSSFVVL
jgi:hypothetical protein